MSVDAIVNGYFIKVEMVSKVKHPRLYKLSACGRVNLFKLEGILWAVVGSRKCKEVEHKQCSWENRRETMKASDTMCKLQGCIK